MKNLIELEKFVSGLGWFSRTVELKISLKVEFEGFYGKASEGWERQVIIELISPDEKICPNIKAIGNRFDTINQVAYDVLYQIGKWKAGK